MGVVISVLCYSPGLHSALKNNGHQMSSGDSLFEQKRGLIHLTKIRVFHKGGDESTLAPPWPIPKVDVITDVAYFTDDQNTNRYIVSNYSFSPGMGNMMFQYAAMLALSIRHNATVLIPEEMLLRRGFRFNLTGIVVSERVNAELNREWNRHLYRQCCVYYNDTEHLNITKDVLIGYFQSHMYFHPEYRQDVLTAFRFLAPIEHRARSVLTKATKGRPTNTILIGVHARRGMDVSLNMRNIRHGHKAAPRRYFDNAIAYYRSRFVNVLFIVASDSYIWVRDHFKGMADVYIVEGEQREVDMSVLSMCNDTIMSVGTFSWWAAYLTGGDVVYYKDWPRAGSHMEMMLNKSQYFLPNWIAMD